MSNERQNESLSQSQSPREQTQQNLNTMLEELKK
jgi:hypothetical protein